MMIIELPYIGTVTMPYRNMHAMVFILNHLGQGHHYGVGVDDAVQVRPHEEYARTEALIRKVECDCGEHWSIDDPQPDTIRFTPGLPPKPLWA